MAQQAGPIFFVGRSGNLVFYKMDGKYYVRLMSSLCGKRVKKDPRFSNTMRNAAWFGQASGIAKILRRALPEKERKLIPIGKFTALVLPLIRQGYSRDEILHMLQKKPVETVQKSEPGLARAKELPAENFAALANAKAFCLATEKKQFANEVISRALKSKPLLRDGRLITHSKIEYFESC